MFCTAQAVLSGFSSCSSGSTPGRPSTATM